MDGLTSLISRIPSVYGVVIITFLLLSITKPWKLLRYLMGRLLLQS